MRRRLGRKSFILVSDGVSYGDKTTIGTAVEYAQRADTIIYSILFADRPHRRRPVRAAVRGLSAQRGRDTMRQMAHQTRRRIF